MTATNGAKPVLLHAHLFKNAGTTLDWSLERSFGDRFCDHRGDADMRANPEYLANFLKRNPRLQALSSHWLPFPLPSVEGLRLVPLVILRDPIERILSVYEFERRQAVDHPGTRKARDGDLQSYVAWRLEKGTGPVVRNYQVRMMSGTYPGSGDEAQFDRAVALLNGLPAIGMVDRYRESAVMFEQTLKQDFPDLDLAFRRQNVRDSSDHRSSDERRAAVEEELGPLLQSVREANSLDIALYELACRRFETHWQGLKESDVLLDELDARCMKLGES
ncbi:hypothetical protein R0135_16895 [Congregibacter variabilis]|uniref:Sulfotransferase family protein n=1 Tax=Congregibacter variabilis TaxID=3081200 RepID=A0ABZ0I311_9GAMM|nr:hypothetical protein R0135_16895 [Congregibacter sp. IMCC43200]